MGLGRRVLGHIVGRHGALGQAARRAPAEDVRLRLLLLRLAVLAHVLVPHHHRLYRKVRFFNQSHTVPYSENKKVACLRINTEYKGNKLDFVEGTVSQELNLNFEKSSLYL